MYAKRGQLGDLLLVAAGRVRKALARDACGDPELDVPAEEEAVDEVEILLTRAIEIDRAGARSDNW